MARMTDTLKIVHKNQQKIQSYMHEQEEIQDEEEYQKRKQVKTPAPSVAISEEASKKLELIIQKIPKRKEDLFAFKINWELFERSNLIEKKLRSWLVQKSIEQIGLEE